MQVGRVDFPLFLLSVFVNNLGLLLFALSRHLLLRAIGVRFSPLDSISTTFISLFVVWLIPILIGSELIRVYLVRNKEGSDLGKAIASVMIHKVMYKLSFGLLITLAALIEASRGVIILIERGLLLFVTLFGITTSLLFGLLLTPHLLRNIFKRLPYWARYRLERGLNNPSWGLQGSY